MDQDRRLELSDALGLHTVRYETKTRRQEFDCMGQMTELQVGKMEESEPAQEVTHRAARPRPPAAKQRWKKILLLAVVAVVLISLVVGGIVWSKRGVVTVQTGKVMRQDLTQIVTANGQIEPPKEKLANVNAEGFGQITAIYVKE